MIYSIILKNMKLIMDFSEEDGDFQEVLFGILKANRQSNEFYVVNYLHYGFYFMHEEEFTFACICTTDIGMDFNF